MLTSVYCPETPQIFQTHPTPLSSCSTRHRVRPGTSCRTPKHHPEVRILCKGMEIWLNALTLSLSFPQPVARYQDALHQNKSAFGKKQASHVSKPLVPRVWLHYHMSVKVCPSQCRRNFRPFFITNLMFL